MKYLRRRECYGAYNSLMRDLLSLDVIWRHVNSLPWLARTVQQVYSKPCAKLRLIDLSWICCGLAGSFRFVVHLDMSSGCGFVVDLLYGLSYDKSTTNRISGVWALVSPSGWSTRARIMVIRSKPGYVVTCITITLHNL